MFTLMKHVAGAPAAVSPTGSPGSHHGHLSARRGAVLSATDACHGCLRRQPRLRIQSHRARRSHPHRRQSHFGKRFCGAGRRGCQRSQLRTRRRCSWARCRGHSEQFALANQVRRRPLSDRARHRAERDAPPDCRHHAARLQLSVRAGHWWLGCAPELLSPRRSARSSPWWMRSAKRSPIPWRATGIATPPPSRCNAISPAIYAAS
jgi:hypothetical protein